MLSSRGNRVGRGAFRGREEKEAPFRRKEEQWTAEEKRGGGSWDGVVPYRVRVCVRVC